MTAMPTGGQVPAADGFAQAHFDLLADPTIQFELQPVTHPAMPDWLVALMRLLDLPEARMVYWLILGLLALWIVYLLATRLLGWSPAWRGKTDEANAPDLRPEVSAARRLLEEADALAREGRFSEAIHLLLVRSVEDIGRRRPGLLRPALTSRDIAGITDLPARPRSAFSRIAMMVERGLFASRPIAGSDWKACRSAYEDFAFADDWRG